MGFILLQNSAPVPALRITPLLSSVEAETSMKLTIDIENNKGPFTNTWKGGGLMQKYLLRKFFALPPSDSKIIQGPPFCHENFTGQPHKKA